MELPAAVRRAPLGTSRAVSSRYTSQTRRILIALAIAGIALLAFALRANGASRHAVFSDEAITLAYVSGWRLADIAPALDGWLEHRLGEVAAFTHPRPGAWAGSTVGALAAEDAQHPPLYYLIARGWRTLFGDDVGTLRALGVVLGLCFIAALGMLARETIGARAGLYAVALAAVSPVFVLYAQQLREYSLWTALIAGTTLALVRAMRTSARAWWLAYGAGLALALWTDTFSLLLPLAFLVIVWHDRASRRPFALATAAALVSWTPWAAVAATHWTIIAASGAPMDAAHLFAKLAFNVSTTVFDAEYGDVRWVPFLVLSLSVIALAFGAAVRARTRNRVGLALALCTIVSLVAIDLATGGHRSASTRALIPAYVGVILIVAALLGSLRGSRAIAASAVLFFGAFVSSLNATSAPVWWDSYASATTPAIAAVMRTSPTLPLIYEGPCASLLTLSIAAPSQTSVRCTSDASAANGAAFVLSPSGRFRADAERAGYQVREIVAARAPSGLVGTFRGAGASEDLDTLWVIHR
jgi:uncharacterized membrane protein